MSLSYLHGEQILPFIFIVLGVEVIGWGVIGYLFCRWWQKRRK